MVPLKGDNSNRELVVFPILQFDVKLALHRPLSTMQFGIFLFFLLTAYGAAAEDACPLTEIVKLAELYANPNLHACQNISDDFSTVSPTDVQVKAICASDTCRALITDVLALEPANCYLSFNKVKINAYKLASSFDNACKTDTDDKQHPTQIDTTNHLKPEELKFVKDVNETHGAGNDNAEDADELKPPFNSSAKELFPMPNTTYKANVLETSNKP